MTNTQQSSQSSSILGIVPQPMQIIKDKWSKDRSFARMKLDWRLKFKEKELQEEFVEYCKYKKLTMFLFFVGFVFCCIMTPANIATYHYDASITEFAYTTLNSAVFFAMGSTACLIAYIQIVEKTILDSYITHFQTIFIVATTLLAISIPAVNVIISDCSRYPSIIQALLIGWHCDKNYIMPMDTLPFYVINPILNVLALNEARVDLILISLILSNTAYFVYSIILNDPHNAIIILGWTVITGVITIDLHIFKIIGFLNHKYLEETLVDNERMAEETRINELRHMIGNVAHDLKTPLSSFMTGMEYINQTLMEFEQRFQENTLDQSYLQEVISGVKQCLHGVKNTNAFMLMTINRCIDYTKASKGLKLTPKNETIHLVDVLQLPLDCMHNIQDKVSIEMLPLPDEVCSHIITDKQWLQENLLCLLSNAVKYTTKGDVTVSGKICTLEELPKMIIVKPLEQAPFIHNLNLNVETKKIDRPTTPLRNNFVNDPSTQKDQILTSTAITPSNHEVFGELPCEDGASVDSVVISHSRSSKKRGLATNKHNSDGNNVEEFESEKASDDKVANLPKREKKYVKVSSQQSMFRTGSITAITSVPSFSKVHPSSINLEASDSDRSLSTIRSNQWYLTSARSFFDSSNQFLRFDIIDTGIGINEETMKALFNPFKQAQRLAGGTGLGLYSLAKRMEAINGRYGVHNRLDGKQGSVFWFAIPYKPDAAFASMYASQNTNQNTGDNMLSLRIGPFSLNPVTNPFTSLLSSTGIAASGKQLSNKNYIIADSSEGKESELNKKTPVLLSGLSANGIDTTSSSPPKLEKIATQEDWVVGRDLTNPSDDGSIHRSGPAYPMVVLREAMMKASSPKHNSSPKHSSPKHSSPKHNSRSSSTIMKEYPSLRTIPSTNSMVPIPSGLEILLVDDSPPIIKMVSMMLRRQGHVITIAENGDIALQMLQKQWENMGNGYDFIVMDLQMPVMDGLETTRRIRKLELEAFVLYKQYLGRGNDLMVVRENPDHWLLSALLEPPTEHTTTAAHRQQAAASSSSAKYSNISCISNSSSFSSTHSSTTYSALTQSRDMMHCVNTFDRESRGLPLSQQLSSDRPIHQLIIGMSANSDYETMQDALSAGMDDFMEKPFSLHSFQEIVNKLLNRFK